jgi:hypothetical protein
MSNLQLGLAIAGAVVLGAFALLFARFIWLQILQHEPQW